MGETGGAGPMSEQPDNILLVYLRRLDGKMDRLIEDGREVKQRLGYLEEQGASISRRVDRLDLRLDRVERRLARDPGAGLRSVKRQFLRRASAANGESSASVAASGSVTSGLRG